MDRQAVPVSEIARRLAEIAEQQRDLETERRALESLRAKAVQLDRTRTSTSQQPGRVGLVAPGSTGAQSVLDFVTASKLGPLEAIETLLRNEPHLRPAEIVKRLADQIQTTSEKPKKVLFQTIANMKKKGRLTESDGRLKLVG